MLLGVLLPFPTLTSLALFAHQKVAIPCGKDVPISVCQEAPSRTVYTGRGGRRLKELGPASQTPSDSLCMSLRFLSMLHLGALRLATTAIRQPKPGSVGEGVSRLYPGLC